MSASDVFEEACEQVGTVVTGAAGADLSRPTPFGHDLRSLVNHVTGTTGALARVGAREPLDPDNPWGSSSDVTGGDWAALLSGQLNVLATTWSRSAAWEGTVVASGPEMPAASLGEMALIEVVVHGWDLARATGQELEVSSEVAAEVRRAVFDTAELGRRMGAYGPAVEVSTEASDLDQALGATGRDPGWTA